MQYSLFLINIRQIVLKFRMIDVHQFAVNPILCKVTRH